MDDVIAAARSALADLTCPQSGMAAWQELGADQKSLVEHRIPSLVSTLNYRSSFSEPWDKGFKYANLSDLRRHYAAWKQSGAAIPADLPGPGSLVLVGSVSPGSGDTGPTEALWQTARSVRGIRAIILECAFPNRLGPLAQVAKHMTPALIRREIDKLPPDIPVWIFHVKPQFYDEIAEELSGIDGSRVSILEQDRIYSI